MSFLESYKRLEKLCGEALNDHRRISAYIEEMEQTPRGSYVVKGWDQDLKQLKYCRFVRNQIVHNPDCTEQNMCEPGDAAFLEEFYSRMMRQTDPLALYYKATKPHPGQMPTHNSALQEYSHAPQAQKSKKTSPKGTALVVEVVCGALVIALLFLAVLWLLCR